MTRTTRRWLLFAALGLVILSAILYAIHFAIFRDAHHIFIYMVGDIAFVPLEVLLVVIIIERLLATREKRALRHKLNMVIGAFYSEIGTHLLVELLPAMRATPNLRERLAIDASWGDADFAKASQYAQALDCRVDLDVVDLDTLKSELTQNKQFLLHLLENPNLLEHESFTDLLWAVLHLEEELEARTSLAGLPRSDRAHLGVDIHRAYSQLVANWIAYIEHLRKEYPYLYSLVLRTHPFQEAPGPTVLE